MNLSVNKLFSIAKKSKRKIIGLMSGTSLDGLDIALCLCSNSGLSTKVKVLNFTTIPYDHEFRQLVKRIFSKREVDLQQVCLLNEFIGIRHAEMILETLNKWEVDPQEIDLIASHGQTIFHAPKSLHGLANFPNATLQIGDGDHIAMKTGIITLSDFRQKHLAAGGEGAPLAVYGDYLIFSKAGENRVMLNIGGISNFTYLPGDKDMSKIFSTDVGPGNTLMDQFVQQNYRGLYYDHNATIASSGTINERLLNTLMDHPFFIADFPKTTGPELFSLTYLNKALLKSKLTKIDNADVLATLCRFSAHLIIAAFEECFKGQKLTVFMSGGGMHNPLLISHLKEGLPLIKFLTTNELKINPDAKEAVLFAVLANESVAGNAIDFGSRQGVPSVCMGKISFPR